MSLNFEPEQLLKVGISALKRRDYERAIATFEQLQQPGISPSYQVKGQMGLVRIYTAQGRWAEATAGCQKLLQNHQPSVRAWAETHLESLLTVRADGATRADVGLKNGSAANLSGFQTLGSESSSKSVADGSGFQPLTPTSASESVEDVTQLTPLSAAAQPTIPAPSSTPASPSPSSPSMPIGSSLFHYANLNQQGAHLSAPALDAVPAPPIAADPNPVSPPTPEQTSPPLTVPADSIPSSPPAETTWRDAAGLKRSQSLGKVNLQRLWLAVGVVALVNFGTLRWVLHTVLRGINGYLQMLDRIFPFGIPTIPAFYRDYTGPLLGVLLGLGLASPWLWDGLLYLSAGLRPLSSRSLQPQQRAAVQILRQTCLQRGWPFPTLKQLPTAVPLIFSYGWRPRFARLVISQGLLDQLQPAEIAALCAYELSHWRRWDWPLLSLQGLLAHAFHQLYWRLALWGNPQTPMVKFTTGTLANASYGLFWLLHKGATWLARLRTYYSDRNATEITGDPNSLARALGKMAFGLATAIQTQGYTPPLVESLDLLLPVNATSIQSVYTRYGQLALADLFRWDSQNPWRGWLSCNQGHPPLGDRLQLLMAYARHWQLEPEIPGMTLAASTTRQQRFWPRLWQQGSPWFGGILGLIVALGLWGVGAIATAAQWPYLDWLYKDISILKSALLISLGIGILLRLNHFFPDLLPPSAATPADLADLSDWHTALDLIPLDTQPVYYRGILLGRPGIANWLGQDLFLQTSSGLLKLHFFSSLGPIGNGLKLGPRPLQYLQQSVQVQGWLHRGYLSWLDVNQLRGHSSSVVQGNHPIWSVVILAVSLICGLGILIKGS